MDFTIDSDQKALRDAVRGTLSGFDATASKQAAGPTPFDADQWASLVEVGVPGLLWSEQDGGHGAGLTELAVAATELGSIAAQTPLADLTLAGVIVEQLADNDLRAQLLGGITDGSVVLLPALEEPGRRFSQGEAGDVTSDGSTVTGTKAPVRFVSAATHFVVSARVGDQTKLFVVANPGTEDDEITFDATTATALEGDVEGALRRAYDVASVVACAEALGAMESALRMTVDYLKTRKQFGVPLATFQALTHRAADMYTSVELARSAVLFGAMELAEDSSPNDTASRVKAVTGKAGRHVGQEAIQLHGGIGMTTEYAVGHLTARLTAIEHTYGDTRHHLGRLSATLGDHEAVDVLH